VETIVSATAILMRLQQVLEEAALISDRGTTYHDGEHQVSGVSRGERHCGEWGRKRPGGAGKSNEWMDTTRPAELRPILVLVLTEE
jgi:hypothetical protein